MQDAPPNNDTNTRKRSIEDLEELEGAETQETRLDRLIRTYAQRANLQLMRPLDHSKKLLILDLDYTLFNHRYRGDPAQLQSVDQLARPGLHEFLGDMYQHYNIGIWSQTGTERLEMKLQQLGLFNNRWRSDYWVSFVVDARGMFEWESERPEDGRARKVLILCL